MTQQNNTKSCNKKHTTPKATMRRTAILVLMTLMTAPGDNTGSALVQQSNGFHTTKTALHSSASEGGGGGGTMGLPPDLQRAYERKNATRKKFGLKPMPIQEFLDLQTQVAQMEQEQAMKYQEQQQRTTNHRQQQQNQQSLGNFAKNLFEKATEDTCISNFDCEAPKVCCDLGVKKMCCSNGMLQVQHEYAFEPIPVDMRD